MLVGRSYIAPGSGGSTPSLVDEDIVIAVDDYASVAAARDAALAYQGRMAPGRLVTLQFPSGVTSLSRDDIRFYEIDFPEFRILGAENPVDGTLWYLLSGAISSVRNEAVEADGERVYDVTYGLYSDPATAGIGIGDILVTASPDVSLDITLDERALAVICGAHPVVATTESSVTVRCRTTASNESAEVLESYSGTLDAAGLTNFGTAAPNTLMKIPCVLDVDWGEYQESDGGRSAVIDFVNSRIGGIGGVVFRLHFSPSDLAFAPIRFLNSVVINNAPERAMAVVSMQPMARVPVVSVANSKVILPAIYGDPYLQLIAAVGDTIVTCSQVFGAAADYGLSASAGAKVEIQYQSRISSEWTAVSANTDSFISAGATYAYANADGGTDASANYFSRIAVMGITSRSPISSPESGVMGNDGSLVFVR